MWNTGMDRSGGRPDGGIHGKGKLYRISGAFWAIQFHSSTTTTRRALPALAFCAAHYSCSCLATIFANIFTNIYFFSGRRL